MTTANKIAAKINTQSVEQAKQVYSGLRKAYIASRQESEVNSASLMKVMVIAGNALEARIGPDNFDALIEKIDEQSYA